MSLPPNMDEVNLGFLKRRDPDAEQILGSSAHVTMYIMSVESQKWERRNVEGTLYVVKRRTNPRFQMVVLNKLSTENYVETIESGFHAEVSPPYLIYTQGGGKVHGVWFYEEADLNRIAGLLTKVESGLPKPPILPPEPQAVAVSAAPAPGDDGGFWDKPVHPNAPHTNGPPAMDQPGPTPPNNNAISNLFKNMQVKQQQQQSQPAPQRPEPAAPTTASAPAPLPPAFFQQQQQQHTPLAPPANKNLDHLRTAAALSPAVSADMAGAGSFSGGENPIAKLFSKQGPPPGAASGLSQSGGGPDRLAALFNNAKSGAPPPAPVQSASPTSRTPTARQAPGRAPIDERLRSALARLVARDEFLALLSEELRTVGLLAS